MSLNGAQRRVFLAGLILLVARAVIPPWKVSFIGGKFGPYGWSEGFGFLLRPPWPSINAYQYDASLHVKVDWSLLLPLCLVTVLMTAGICLVFMKYAEESDARFFKMLETRKVLSSLLIGLGFPIPLLGIPAAYYWASLLVNGVGFESQGMLFISVAAFVGLTTLCLLFLALLQTVKSFVVRRAVMVVVAVMLIGVSLGGQLALQRSERSREKRLQKNHVAAVASLHNLNSALAAYKACYGEYPATLDGLGFSAHGAPPDKSHASLIQFPLADGIQKVYTFAYHSIATPGAGAGSYEIQVDQIENTYDNADGVHFYTSESGTIRSCLMCPHAHADDAVAE
ncbi:MAG: hypothetical protein ABSF72_07745 [Candidatus Sulfotelmatobacter sp.]|jgi:hypothetical protein